MSAPLISVAFLSFLLRFALFPDKRCRRPAFLRNNFPRAVTFTRFATDFFVLSFLFAISDPFLSTAFFRGALLSDLRRIPRCLF